MCIKESGEINDLLSRERHVTLLCFLKLQNSVEKTFHCHFQIVDGLVFFCVWCNDENIIPSLIKSLT